MENLNRLLKARDEIQKEIDSLADKLKSINKKIESAQNTFASSNNLIKDFVVIGHNEWENDKTKKKVTTLFVVPQLEDVLDEDYKLTTYRREDSFEAIIYEPWMEDIFKGVAFYVVPSNSENYYVFLLLVCNTPVSEKQREQIRNFRVLDSIKYKSTEYELIEDKFVRDRIVFMTRYNSKYSYSNDRIIDDYLTIKRFALRQVSQNVKDIKEFSNISKKEEEHDHALEKRSIRIPAVYSNGEKGFVGPVVAYYCRRCDCYFLTDDVIKTIKNKKIVLFSRDPFEKVNGSGYGDDLEAQSLLNICGYNVNANTGYTEKQRHAILDGIIENGILTIDRIMNYLAYFIRRSQNQESMKQANEKWSNDLRYLHLK